MFVGKLCIKNQEKPIKKKSSKKKIEDEETQNSKNTERNFLDDIIVKSEAPFLRNLF